MLREGVKIYFDFPDSLENRVWLSEGTESAKDCEFVDYIYNDLAIKPKKPWRLATNEELKILCTTQKPSEDAYSNHIGITKLPSSLVSELQSLGVSKLLSKEDILSFYKTQEYEKSFLILDNYITKYSNSNHKISYYKYFLDQPNLDVVTINYGNNVKTRIGLHIDNRDQLSIYDAEAGRSLFLINLSSENRYFLFVNQTSKNIIDWIENKNGCKLPKDYTAEFINKDFSDYFPSYNVVKLKIKPFEAYIAPNENIIHDGCTEGCINPSLRFFAGGVFTL